MAIIKSLFDDVLPHTDAEVKEFDGRLFEERTDHFPLDSGQGLSIER